MRTFKKVYIEITNVCNLSCEFCPKTTRLSKFMTVFEFEDIIKKINHLTEYIYLHIMGEPLLHAQLEELLFIAQRYNKKVIITTNGTLINEKKRILLSSPALYKIVFSIHSFEANSSEKSLENYLNSIINFCKIADGMTNIITALRLWNYDKDYLKGNSLLNADIFNIIEKAFDIEEINAENLLFQRGIKLSDKIYLQGAQRFEWPDLNRDEISQKAFCYGLRDHFGIQADGTVVPCCLDNNGEINLGNIFSEDIDAILGGERAEKIYHGFNNRQANEELCKRCEFVTKFKK